MDPLTSADENSDSYIFTTCADLLDPYEQSDGAVLGDAQSLYDSDSILQLFVSTFNSVDGIVSQIAAMYTASPRGSLVRAAVAALTMERQGLDTSNRHLLAQAQAEYGRTLLKVREALGDPVESRQDTTLATIQLLCHFEVRRYYKSVFGSRDQRFSSFSGQSQTILNLHILMVMLYLSS